jgi:hypothetical protein
MTLSDSGHAILAAAEEAAVAGEEVALSADGTGLVQPASSAAPKTPTKLNRLFKLMTPPALALLHETSDRQLMHA